MKFLNIIWNNFPEHSENLKLNLVCSSYIYSLVHKEIIELFINSGNNLPQDTELTFSAYKYPTGEIINIKCDHNFYGFKLEKII